MEIYEAAIITISVIGVCIVLLLIINKIICDYLYLKMVKKDNEKTVCQVCLGSVQARVF